MSNNIKCKYCNCNIVCKYGKSPLNKQRYKCSKCHRTFINDMDNRIKFNSNIKSFAILTIIS